MKLIEKNLLTSARIACEEAVDMVDLINEQPDSQHVDLRRERAGKKIVIAQTFLKVLRIITCNHDNGKGDSTEVEWHQITDDEGKKESYQLVKKRCNKCNQVFYFKKRNLLKRKRK